MDNLNSFQKWALAYASHHGFDVTMRGNWVELRMAGDGLECMTYMGVIETVEAHKAYNPTSPQVDGAPEAAESFLGHN